MRQAHCAWTTGSFSHCYPFGQMPYSHCVDYQQNCEYVPEKKMCREIISCDSWADVVQVLHPLPGRAQYPMAKRDPPLGWILPSFFSVAFLLLLCCHRGFFSFFHSSPQVLYRKKNQLLFFNHRGNQYHHVIKQFILNKANLCQDKSKQNYNPEE